MLPLRLGCIGTPDPTGRGGDVVDEPALDVPEEELAVVEPVVVVLAVVVAVEDDVVDDEVEVVVDAEVVVDVPWRAAR